MNLRFYIDPETGVPHIYNHSVSEAEVEDVLVRPGEDRSGRDDSRVAIGQTQTGRYLRVIYVRDSDLDDIFVITAYELTGKPGSVPNMLMTHEEPPVVPLGKGDGDSRGFRQQQI